MNALHSFHRGAGLAATLLFAIVTASAWAAAPTAPPGVRSELAPTAQLRVGLLTQNPSFVTKDGAPAEMQGVAVELGRELAKQLGVPFAPVRYASVAKLIDGGKAGEWDVAFLGFEQERTAYMDFTAPYLEVGNTYLVPAGSKIRNLADVDKPGQRIAVTQRSVQDRYLSKNIKHAELIRVGSGSDAAQLLSAGKVHVITSNRIVLLKFAKEIPGSRLLDENYMTARHVLAVAKNRPAGTAYAKKFIEHAKASGSVQQAIARAQLHGAKVAALEPGM